MYNNNTTRANLTPAEEFAAERTLIAKGCSYSLDDEATRLNNNILIVGGSGTGKTSTIVIPNIKEAVGSYIVSDPKGNLYRKLGGYLRERGYKVHNVDFTHPERSDRYNPLRHIRTTQDIVSMAAVITNEKASEGTRADPFWDQSAIMLLSAIIGYMLEDGYRPFNFSGILRLMREGDRPGDDTKKSDLAQRFEHLRRRNPDSWACAQFANVNQAPDRTYDSIRATLATKLARFDTEELQLMMNGSDIDFEAIGSEKTAVFVTVSDSDRSLDPLANIFFTQAMQQLCSFADELESSRLPVPVRFILDDFATNCKIEEFPRMISSIRSRGVSVMLMIQAESQLAQSYGPERATIIANCDTYVYLGGNDYDTAQAVANRCNKPVQQILYMPIGSCWVFRRGAQPVCTETLPPEDKENSPERREH